MAEADEEGEWVARIYISTFWVDGAATPLVRFTSASDPNPKVKTNPSFRYGNGWSYISVVGGGCSLHRNFLSSQILMRWVCVTGN